MGLVGVFLSVTAIVVGIFVSTTVTSVTSMLKDLDDLVDNLKI